MIFESQHRRGVTLSSKLPSPSKESPQQHLLQHTRNTLVATMPFPLLRFDSQLSIARHPPDVGTMAGSQPMNQADDVVTLNVHVNKLRHQIHKQRENVRSMQQSYHQLVKKQKFDEEKLQKQVDELRRAVCCDLPNVGPSSVRHLSVNMDQLKSISNHLDQLVCLAGSL